MASRNLQEVDVHFGQEKAPKLISGKEVEMQELR